MQRKMDMADKIGKVNDKVPNIQKDLQRDYSIKNLECYILPLIAGLVLFILSLFFFSNSPIIDALIKAFILAAVLFLVCIFLIPSEPIIITINSN
jgi:hypothetical protein